MSASEAAAAAAPARVACCLAGAWRDWALSWRYVGPNIVEALDADVYAVSDTVVRTPGTHACVHAACTLWWPKFDDTTVAAVRPRPSDHGVCLLRRRRL